MAKGKVKRAIPADRKQVTRCRKCGKENCGTILYKTLKDDGIHWTKGRFIKNCEAREIENKAVEALNKYGPEVAKEVLKNGIIEQRPE